MSITAPQWARDQDVKNDVRIRRQAAFCVPARRAPEGADLQGPTIPTLAPERRSSEASSTPGSTTVCGLAAQRAEPSLIRSPIRRMRRPKNPAKPLAASKDRSHGRGESPQICCVADLANVGQAAQRPEVAVAELTFMRSAPKGQRRRKYSVFRVKSWPGPPTTTRRPLPRVKPSLNTPGGPVNEFLQTARLTNLAPRPATGRHGSNCRR